MAISDANTRLRVFLSKNRELIEHVTWLETDQKDVAALLDSATVAMPPRLPIRNLNLFQRGVVLGSFINSWVHRYRIAGWDASKRQNGQDTEDSTPPDFALFERAVILTADQRAFKKLLPKMCRKRAMEKAGPPLGSGEEFESYVATHSKDIALKSYQNLDINRADSARMAPNFVKTIALSMYLHRHTKSAAQEVGGLLRFLKENRKISERNRLATLLAYFPTALTMHDRKTVLEQFGWDVTTGRKYRIAEIASKLRYKDPQALSRKLWKINKGLEVYREEIRAQQRTLMDGSGADPD